MDLYDDLDTKQRAGQIDGWSSGIKLMQTQMAIKKPAVPTPTRKDFFKRSTVHFLIYKLTNNNLTSNTFHTEPTKMKVLTPVMQLKSKRDAESDDIFSTLPNHKPKLQTGATTTTITTSASVLHTTPLTPSSKVFNDYDWDVVDEYDPLWPNEYEKLVKERREKDGTNDKRAEKRSDTERPHGFNERKRRNNRFEHDASPNTAGKNKFSGFGGRPDEEDAYERSSPPSGSAQGPRTGGAAIAPPPSLQESTPIIPAFANLGAAAAKDAAYGANSVAAKIMAKYGFKVFHTY